VDLWAVMDEISTVAHTITGLRNATWASASVTPPALMAGWPERVEFSGTYQRKQTRVPDLPLLVVVGRASGRVSAKRLGEFVAETGTKSVPAKIMARAGLWVACDMVDVKSVTFPAVSIGAIDYLAAEFHLDVIGKGT
jgi:hypothetical protein